MMKEDGENYSVFVYLLIVVVLYHQLFIYLFQHFYYFFYSICIGYSCLFIYLFFFIVYVLVILVCSFICFSSYPSWIIVIHLFVFLLIHLEWCINLCLWLVCCCFSRSGMEVFNFMCLHVFNWSSINIPYPSWFYALNPEWFCKVAYYFCKF